jgi:hypothetical protein
MSEVVEVTSARFIFVFFGQLISLGFVLLLCAPCSRQSLALDFIEVIFLGR